MPFRTDQDQRAEQFLLNTVDWSQPHTFRSLNERRTEADAPLHIEAIRRAVWTLIESGELILRPDRRISRGRS